MNEKHKLSASLMIFLILIFISGGVRANSVESNYAFVIFETTVTRQGAETSNQIPEERRFYVSNVVEFPETDASVFRNAAREANAYFTAAVVEPMQAKGILHKYYDDDIRINNKVIYSLDMRVQVEDLQNQTLQDLKEQSANVFTFNWVRNAKSKDLETSQPKLFYRQNDKPLYQMSGGEKQL